VETLGFLASFVMGIILGLVGGGGSILTVPIMVYLFGFSPTVATSNSLFVVGLAALIGSVLSFRKGEIDFKAGFSFAVPSVIGVNVSRGLILPKIPETIASLHGFAFTKEILIMVTFAALMIAASYSMIKKKSEKKPMSVPTFIRISLIAFGGLVVGLIAGFVGAGGGFLIIPALVFWAGLSMRVAIGTSLLIIALQSLLGFAGDIARGATAEWSRLALIASIAVLGIIVGSAFARKVNEQQLKTGFGWLVLIMGFTILVEQFRHLSFY
jgi:uncharacterized protein